MRAIQLTITLFTICFFTFAQTNTSVRVFLNNGCVINEVILEHSAASGIKRKTMNESIHGVKCEDTVKVKLESNDVPVLTPPKYENDKISPVNTVSVENLGSSGFYIGASSGYGFDALSDVFNSYKSISVVSSNYQVDFHSFGSGIEFSALAGYRFNATYGAEIAFSYQNSNDFYLRSSMISPSNDPPDTYYNDYIYTSSSFSIIPTVVFTLPKLTEVIQPFIKAGMVFAFPRLKHINKAFNTKSEALSTSSEIEYARNLSAGSLFTIGSNFYIARDICVTGELFGVFLNHKPSSYTYTEYDGIGAGKIKTYTTKVNLRDSFSFPDNHVTSARVFSWSRIGIRCGLIVLL